jgi:transcriptional regulator with XRE-family HTH domain
LKQLRNEKGWSQELLARASGISLRTIQRIESEGNASAESALAIASAMEVSPTELQSTENPIEVNWKRRKMMQGFISLLVAFGAIFTVITLAAEPRDYGNKVVFVFLFTYLATTTIITFGVEGLNKSIRGLGYVFASDIVGGKQAQYLAAIYSKQITYSYACGAIGFLVGVVAIHSNLDLIYIHDAYAVNALCLLYSAILSECVLRPLKNKLETCDIIYS